MIDASNGPRLIDEGPVDSAAIDAAKAEVEEAKKEIEAVIGVAATDTISAAPEEPGGTREEPTPVDVSPPDSQVAGDVAKEIDAADTSRSFKETPWADTNYNGPAWLEPHARRLYEAGQRVSEDPRLFASEARANVPRFLLLAPVVYGLTLTLLYFYRRKFFVYDHFIVSLYMHAALYAYLLLALLINRIPVVGGWLWFFPIGWGMLQPLVVLRQAYSSNWLSVWVKWFISIIIYLVAFALIITLGLSYSLYQS